MKIRILAVGHKMPAWVEQGCADYLKRIPQETMVEIVAIKPDKRTAGKSGNAVREVEAQRILKAAGSDYLVAMDEHGQELTTQELADRLRLWLADGRELAFAIGGADGLHDQVKQAADWQWSLSRLTLPHGMVRVLLVEQLYRAWSMLNRHPYHRGDC